MKRNIRFLALLFVFTVCFASCKEKSRFKVNLDKHWVSVSIKRFDQALIGIDTAQVRIGVDGLYQRYPLFFPVFCSEVLAVSPEDTVLVATTISEFLKDTLFRSVNSSVLERFSSVEKIEHSLSTAFSYAHFYFPQFILPEVYFFVSGFNLSLMGTENFLGAGADLYLGADYPYYSLLTYRYLAEKMKPESIAPDLILFFLKREFPQEGGKERLLDQILYQGKLLFLLSVFLPDIADENLIAYGKDQLSWSKRNEALIWGKMIDDKHLFSSDNMLIRQYVDEAPFTAAISQDSPGRLGSWIGWQIIKSYMYSNPSVSLPDLMREDDADKLLQKSGYRP